MVENDADKYADYRLASSIWSQLERIHEHRTAESKILLMQRFQNCRMEATESVADFFMRVQSAARALEEVNEKVSDTSILARILSGLPPKFDALVTAWDSVDSEKQTVSALQERLVKEETRLSSREQERTTLISTTTGNNNNNFVNKDKNRVKSSKRTLQRSAVDMSKVVCYNCKREGHYARTYPKKKKNKRPADDTSSLREDEEMVGFIAVPSWEPQCLNVELSDSSWLSRNPDEVWFSDIGASCHTIFRREWFPEFRITTPQYVFLGDNGACEVTGIGTVKIKRLVGDKWVPSFIDNVYYVPKLRKNLFSVGVCDDNGLTGSIECSLRLCCRRMHSGRTL